MESEKVVASETTPNATLSPPSDHARPTVSPVDTMVEAGVVKEGVEPTKALTPAQQEEERLRLEAMPKGARLYLVMLGLLMAVYVVSLDQTIVNPAIPIISNEFNALEDVGWYGSAYFLTSTCIQPLFGRIYRLNLKWPYVACLVIFEVGSIVCATAHESSTFIVGRAIAGAGLAGGYIGTMLIVADSVPLDKVPVWSGAIGAIYGVGAITGPLIGGVFTSEVTWRWCFWLSLPLGGTTIGVIILFFHPRPRHNDDGSFLKTALKLDWTGTALSLGAMISYLLAMQDGGLKYAWSTSREIGLLVGAVLMTIAFFINEYFWKDNALIPLRIFKQRGIWSSAIANIGIGGAYFSVALLLPIYFQLLGSSSIRSGVQMLPLVCGVIFSVSVAGGAAPAVGYIQPFMYFGSVCGIVASGLFQLLDENTKQPYWVGVTFLFGIGLGAIFQAPFILSQTVGTGQDTEIGSSIVIFFQTLGGTVWVGAAQAIYSNVFKQHVMKIPDIDTAAVIASGVTGFRNLVSPEALPALVSASMVAVQNAFIPACALIGLTLIATTAMPYNSVKNQVPGAGGA